MLTRRYFCLSAGLTPVALAAVASDSPIAKLKSRRTEAQPITPAERSTRIERAQKLMFENKINSICLAGGTSLEYFSGVRWGNSERLFIMVIPRAASPSTSSPALKRSAPASKSPSPMETAAAPTYSPGTKTKAPMPLWQRP
jgi:Xaa-Pro dipeptidase